MTTVALSRAVSRAVWPVGALGMALALALGLAVAPLATAGIFLGGVLFVITLVRPLWVLGLMLAIGAVDLSFITGGRLLDDWWGIDMSGMRLIVLVMAMTIIVMVDRRALRHLFGPRGRWYLLFLIYGGLTLAFSPAPLDGARLLLKLAYPLLVFLAIMTLVRGRRDLERLGDWTLVGGLAVALVVTPVLLLMGEYHFDLMGRLRSPGIGLHQNPLSFYMLLLIIISVARYAARGQRRYLAAAGVFAVWVILSYTRIALLATVNAFLVIALFAAWRQRDVRVPAAAAALVVVIGILAVPMTLQRTFGTIPSVPELTQMATDPVALYHRMDFHGRELVWPVVGQVFLQNPVFGRGMGTSTMYVVAMFDPSRAGVVHNEYLRLAADTGLVGLILFAMAMGAWLVTAARTGRLPGPVREYAGPAGAGIVIWATVALTDNPFDYYASLTQYVGFLVAGALWLSENPDHEQAESRQPAAGHRVAGPRGAS